MNEFNSKIPAIENVFKLLDKTGSMVSDKDEYSIHKTNINGFNVVFSKHFSEGDTDIYNIKINDENNDNLFRLVISDSPPSPMPKDLSKYSREKRISLHIDKEKVDDSETIKNLLNSCLFDEILEKTTKKIEEFTKLKNLAEEICKKPLHERVLMVMKKINEIRTNENETNSAIRNNKS